jgi:hypothetical protein
LTLREAELRWVRELLSDISDGTLGGMAEWEGFHADRDAEDTRKEESGV